MKKCFLFSIILFFPIIASAVQYACPNQTQAISNSEEINEGAVKSILSLPIGICGASENSYSQWIESTIFFDAKLISLDASNQTKGTELLSVNKSISYITTSGSNQVELKIDSSTAELEIGDCSELGSLVVMVKSIQISESLVEVLVAAKKTTLNTKQKPSEIIEVNSKKYAVQLLAGSHTESTVKLSKCSSGDIYEIAEVIPAQVQNTTNSTINDTTTNETIINQTINETNLAENTTTELECPNIGLINNSKYCNPDGFYIPQKELNVSCSSDYECLTDYCKESLCVKKSFFKAILDWLKGLFS